MCGRNSDDLFGESDGGDGDAPEYDWGTFHHVDSVLGNWRGECKFTPFSISNSTGCPNGTQTVSPIGTVWMFTVRSNQKNSYITYVGNLGGWMLDSSRSVSGGNWALQFHCNG